VAGPEAEVFWVTTPDGARLSVASVGTGSNVAVLIHESGRRGRCGAWPYAAWLAEQGGVRAVIFDQCGYGASECPPPHSDRDLRWVTNTEAVVAHLRSEGATRVTLIGASMGGIAALVAASTITPPVDAVADLSGEVQIRSLVSIDAARTLQMPVLYAVAPGDTYISVEALRTIADATPAKLTRFVEAPEGAGHGWDMLSTVDRSGWTDLAITVRDWLRAPSA
jgi:alpha-beta hydrolase superfamily lysophospholipase